MSLRLSRPLIALVTVCALAALVLGLYVIPALGSPSFPDVPADHPHAAAIADLSTRGIINGYANGKYGPNDPVKRAQFAKMICGVMDLQVAEDDWPDAAVPFTDLGADLLPGPTVIDSLYPHEYVAIAYLNDITNGQTNTTFAPYDGIKRAGVISMMVRAALNLRPGLLVIPPAGYTGSFPNLGAPHGQNVRIAEYNGLMTGLAGFGSSWDPWALATRGETAQMLHNLLGKLSPPTTTTTSSSTTTTTEGTTTTTSSTTTTTSTTTSSTTSTTVPSPSYDLAPASDYCVADGVTFQTVTATVYDQFGNPLPLWKHFDLWATVLEGQDLYEGQIYDDISTDAYGQFSFSWASPPGAWGVQELLATYDPHDTDDPDDAELESDPSTIQWIYKDGTGDPGTLIYAYVGQTKANVNASIFPWIGHKLSVYLNPFASAVGGPASYTGDFLFISTSAGSWTAGETFYVRSNSDNDDGVLNWVVDRAGYPE